MRERVRIQFYTALQKVMCVFFCLAGWSLTRLSNCLEPCTGGTGIAQRPTCMCAEAHTNCSGLRELTSPTVFRQGNRKLVLVHRTRKPRVPVAFLVQAPCGLSDCLSEASCDRRQGRNTVAVASEPARPGSPLPRTVGLLEPWLCLQSLFRLRSPSGYCGILSSLES